MAELQLPKLIARVRFPSSPPMPRRADEVGAAGHSRGCRRNRSASGGPHRPEAPPADAVGEWRGRRDDSRHPLRSPRGASTSRLASESLIKRVLIPRHLEETLHDRHRRNHHPPSTRSRGLARQIAILVSSVLAIVAAFIGSGAFFGTPIQQAAGGFLDADSTLIAPGTGAFRIWSVIYTGMLAYAIWQALPAQRDDPRQIRIGWWVAASLILNAVWIGVVQADLLYLSLPVIAALLAVLCRIFVILRRTSPKNRIEAVVADGAIGLYLGWVIIADRRQRHRDPGRCGLRRIRHRAGSLGRPGAGGGSRHRDRPRSVGRRPDRTRTVAVLGHLLGGRRPVHRRALLAHHRDRRHHRSRPHHRRDGVRASATRPSRATLDPPLPSQCRVPRWRHDSSRRSRVDRDARRRDGRLRPPPRRRVRRRRARVGGGSGIRRRTAVPRRDDHRRGH